MTASLIERLLTFTIQDRRALADEVLLACGWQTNFDRKTIEEVRAKGENGEEDINIFAVFMDCACWYAPGNKPFKDAWLHGYARPNPLTSIDDAIALIPTEFFWLIGKGRTRPMEPLFSVRLFRKTEVDFDDIPFAESGHEDGPTAICVAALLARGSVVLKDMSGNE